ncbi:MAG TPA: HEAT repeat domain-containing protein, partial [Chryseolinea sp.]|nr:HEAT repeat domain-containing protein [Chryseolinea sp.]
MRYTIPFLFFVTAICSCTNERSRLHKFDDPELIKIADLQDRRAGDSLKAYLENINPSYRSAAALAYASVQDSAFIPHLRKLILEDFEPTVRMAAAYAIGQTPSSISERVLTESISKEKNNVVLAEAIESYGKVCTSWKLNLS